MLTKMTARGKRRAETLIPFAPKDTLATFEAETSASSLSSPSPEESAPPPAKRRKRADTRPCPVCSDPIPVRLLGAHAVLESQRLQALIDAVGDEDVWLDPHSTEFDTATTSRRRSAVRAQAFFGLSSSQHPIASSSSPSPLTHVTKTLTTLKRHRKQRHAALRDLTHDLDDDDGALGRRRKAKPSQSEPCPVCAVLVHGDPDVVAAHVDACILHASMQAEIQAREDDVDADPWEEIRTAEGTRVRLRLGGRSASVQGLGFERTSGGGDEELDVDVDGDDARVFGTAQFTEADVMGLNVVVDVVDTPPGDDTPDRLDKATVLDTELQRARDAGDKDTLIAVLEAKLTSPSTSACRICLDPYVEPTVSTGCWHACCRGCWLRCLGSSGLCPICKRITAAVDLRRIYL